MFHRNVKVPTHFNAIFLAVGFACFFMMFSTTAAVAKPPQRLGIFPGKDMPEDQLYIDLEVHEYEFESDYAIYQSRGMINKLEQAKHDLQAMLDRRQQQDYLNQQAATEEKAKALETKLRVHEKAITYLQDNVDANESIRPQIEALLQRIQNDVDYSSIALIFKRLKASRGDNEPTTRKDRSLGKPRNFSSQLDRLRKRFERYLQQMLALSKPMEEEAEQELELRKKIQELDPQPDDRVVYMPLKGGRLADAPRYIIRKEWKRFVRYRLCELEEELGVPTWISHAHMVDAGMHRPTGWRMQRDTVNNIRCYLFLGEQFIFFNRSSHHLFDYDDNVYRGLWLSKELLPFVVGLGVAGVAFKALQFGVRFAYLKSALASAEGMSAAGQLSAARRVAQIISSGQPRYAAFALATVPTTLVAGVAYETARRLTTLTLTADVRDAIETSLRREPAWYARVTPSYWEEYRKVTHKDIVNGSHANYAMNLGVLILPTQYRVHALAKRLAELFPVNSLGDRLTFAPPFRMEVTDAIKRIRHDENTGENNEEEDERVEIGFNYLSMSSE